MKELSLETIDQIRALAGDYEDSKEKLMEILLKVQNAASNQFGKTAMTLVSETTGIPESKLYEYTTFYSRFSTELRGKYVVRMCKSAPCHVCGAKEVADAILEYLGVKPGETTADGLFTVEFCECIGLCESSPSVMINDTPYSNLDTVKIREILSQYQKEVAI